MYHILLVDDELPALRFLETIITKYASDFTVVNQLRDGASALAWLKEQPDSVDVLITDIRMPDTDGITLAKTARDLRPDLHIVIVSGYSEFEYAHGAIEASVDDYILKPVSVSHMKTLLEKIKSQLDAASKTQIFRDLTALLKGKPVSPEKLHKTFGDQDYFFALLRYGNVLYPQKSFQETTLFGILSCQNQTAAATPEFTLEHTALLTNIDPKKIYILTGRDDKEFLLFAKASGSMTAFQNIVRQFVKGSGSNMDTVVFCQSGMPFENIASFYLQASKVLRHIAVFGHYQEAVLNKQSGSDYSSAAAILSPTVTKRLQLCVSENNLKDIESIFQSLGKEWDEAKVTQRQAYVMIQKLLHLVETVRRDHWKDTDEIMTEADTLTNTASSCQELLENLFKVLYDPEMTALKQGSPEDMYQYAIRTIHKKFNQPISIQTVCSEIGISQTYLSRLFRKYGSTSFNTYLVQHRMDNAKKMLKEQPDIPLHHVAVCVGYDDYAYFSKVFRQATGMSPSQYQASLK